MHVLLIPSWYPTTDRPAEGCFFRDQALALKRAGHEVGVIAPSLLGLASLPRALMAHRRDADFSDDQGVRTYRSSGWRWLPLIRRASAALWVRGGLRLFERYISEHGRPEVVHAHCAILGGLLAALLKQRFGVPVVITEHASRYALGPMRALHHRLARTAFAAADCRLAVSPRLGELLESLYGEAFRPWTSVPNLLDPIFTVPTAEAISRSAPNGFRFLHIALFSPNKGQRELLEAFSRAFRGDSTTRLAIGGDGPIGGELVAIARRLGVTDQVDFLGWLTRSAVREQMVRSSAFVLSSRYETFSVVLIEALACGLPVIATRCGGPETIVEKDDGLLVPTRDPDALAHAMKRMRAGVADFDRADIHRRSVVRFGEQAVVRQLEAEYRKALARPLQDAPR